jgi:hypothetical protein
VVGETLRIADYARDEGVVRDMEFEDCTVRGPAVLVPLRGVEIGDCRFDADLERLFWTTSPGEPPAGGIGLENCIFRTCRFEKVGLGGTPESIRQLIKGFDFA